MENTAPSVRAPWARVHTQGFTPSPSFAPLRAPSPTPSPASLTPPGARVPVAAAVLAALPAKPGLGKNALSFTPPPSTDASQDGREAVRKVRAERYALQAAARALLLQEGKREGLLYPAEFHKTAKCLHVQRAHEVGVLQSRAHRAAFFSGLVTCGSVWACAVCAAKIQERRRLEVSQAMDWAYGRGLQPVMVTLTFPHRAWHDLATLLDQQAFALAKLRAGAPWTRFKERHGFEGLIRSLELTRGRHGWHPHTHEMWFVSAQVDAATMRQEILSRWESMCIRAGLLDSSNAKQVKAFRQHAVDVKGWCSNSDYLNKVDESRHWGADRELAKASTKAGRAKGKHPLGLLADYADGNQASGRLFLEYVEAMRGKAQLYFGPGLKARVGLEDKDDDEIAAEVVDEADLLGQLETEDWQTVREARAQSQVLDAAERGGWPAVAMVLEHLTRAAIERLEALLAADDPPPATWAGVPAPDPGPIDGQAPHPA